MTEKKQTAELTIFIVSQTTQNKVTRKSTKFQLLAQNAQKCSINFSTTSSTNIANTIAHKGTLSP